MAQGDGCGDGETLNASKSRRPGTDAIRQECLMHSRLSASQAPDLQSCACPGRRDLEALRVSPIAADAPLGHLPPAAPCFLCVAVHPFGGCGR